MATERAASPAPTSAPVAPRVRSPLTVSASFFTPIERDDLYIKEEATDRFTPLPVFADLIRASYLANGPAMSPLPSLSKTSIGFLLDTTRKPTPQDLPPLEPLPSPHGEFTGRASISSVPSPTMSPRDSTALKRDSSKRKVRPASRTCKFENCHQYVVDHGLCVRHGGGKRCTMEGCTSRAKHYGRCWRHGGSMECKVSGCVNRAKSRGYCWSHGGGTKCKSDDCEKIAISNGLCWAHGGGKRCGAPGCMKQAYERTGNLCNSHFQQSKRET